MCFIGIVWISIFFESSKSWSSSLTWSNISREARAAHCSQPILIINREAGQRLPNFSCANGKLICKKTSKKTPLELRFLFHSGPWVWINERIDFIWACTDRLWKACCVCLNAPSQSFLRLSDAGMMYNQSALPPPSRGTRIHHRLWLPAAAHLCGDSHPFQRPGVHISRPAAPLLSFHLFLGFSICFSLIPCKKVFNYHPKISLFAQFKWVCK